MWEKELILAHGSRRRVCNGKEVGWGKKACGRWLEQEAVQSPLTTNIKLIKQTGSGTKL